MSQKHLHDQQRDSSLNKKELISHEDHEIIVGKSDVELWNAFKRGEEKALISIYKEYVNKMFNYGCQFTSQHEWVSDCIQELFTELISKRHKLGDTHSIKFYLFKALRRKLFRKLKQEKKFLHTDPYMNAEGFNILEDRSIKFIDQEFTDQQKEIISNECNKLPPRQKEAILLYFYEGMSYKDIAVTIGMSRTKSARALIYRAIDSLASHLIRYKNILYPFWFILLAAQ